jgi:hypothetical protein
MRAIPVLDVDATEIFDDIAAAKQLLTRKRMRAVRAGVIAAYNNYDGAVPEVGTLEAIDLTDLQKDALRHAFTVETAPMKALRGDLLNRVAVAKCPFCNISESSTLDHYLPKEHFPEFSVLPPNLVPSCAVCNTRKRDKVLEEGTDVRMFLHPCYDTIPEAAFLDVRTRLEDDALVISYRICRPQGMSLQTYRHLQAHFRVLNLGDRYRRMGLENLGELYPSFRRAYGAASDAARVAEKLIDDAYDVEESFGPNFWRAKLYRSLAANDAFCDGGFEAIKVYQR